MKGTLSHITEELTGRDVTSDAWRIIIEMPAQLAPMTLRLERPFAMGAVYQATGDADNPIQLIGDYENPSHTVVQIPGWLWRDRDARASHPTLWSRKGLLSKHDQTKLETRNIETNGEGSRRTQAPTALRARATRKSTIRLRQAEQSVPIEQRFRSRRKTQWITRILRTSQLSPSPLIHD